MSLTWSIQIEKKARKSLEKLDPKAQQRIIDYLYNRLAARSDPRSLGKPLTGNYKGLWRYRVDDYRIRCSIEDKTITILVIAIAHRREAYQ